MGAQRLSMLVDSARFFLFHPRDCPDAAGDIDPPADALARGLVVGLQLGADGNRAVELVEGPLSDADRADVEPEPFVFPLEVTRGRLFATDRMAGLDDYDWAKEPGGTLEPGTYRADWYVFTETAWPRRNANWLLVVTPVPSLDGLTPWAELPDEFGPRRPPPPLKTRAHAQRRRVRHPTFEEGGVVSETATAARVLFDDGVERKIQLKFLAPVVR